MCLNLNEPIRFESRALVWMSMESWPECPDVFFSPEGPGMGLCSLFSVSLRLYNQREVIHIIMLNWLMLSLHLCIRNFGLVYVVYTHVYSNSLSKVIMVTLTGFNETWYLHQSKLRTEQNADTKMFHSTYNSCMELHILITRRPVVNAKVFFNCLDHFITITQNQARRLCRFSRIQKHYHYLRGGQQHLKWQCMLLAPCH